MHSSASVILIICCLSASATGCAWYPKSLDDDIDAARREVEARRTELSTAAGGYRVGPGKDFQVEVSAKPVRETLERFNGLSVKDRTMTMISTRAGGRLGEAWTDCPWPFSGHLGVWLAPATFAGGFGSVISIDELEYLSWHPSKGLEFALRGTGGAGYLVALGGVDLCFTSFPVVPMPVGIVGYTYYASGGAHVETDSEGMTYRVQLEQPLNFLAVAYVLGWTIPAPLFLKPQLFSGKVKNVVGTEGEVRIGTNGPIRKYRMDVNYSGAHFVKEGMAASGAVVVSWMPTH